MNGALLAIFGLAALALAYRFYSRFIARVFGVDDDEPTPAHRIDDGVDYVPTRLHILFGHHFTSVAGAAPIVGPAVAVIWGWLPAVLWVVFGSILIGAVHDFGALVMSAREGGASVGKIAEKVFSVRARDLFLIVILLLNWIVIAVFALIIALLFVSYPEAVLPINFEIVVALVIGWLVYRKGWGALLPSLLAVGVLYALVGVGLEWRESFHMPGLLGLSPVMVWIVLLLVYAFVASILPVQVLLQPRDFLNSHQLFLGLGAIYLGLFLGFSDFRIDPASIPAFQWSPPGAPPFLPFLFVTIACGAVSGFHGLVSSGTTSKQLDRFRDARPIGYGGMLGEGALALAATLACTCGFLWFLSHGGHGGATAWHGKYYASWSAANGLSAKLFAFTSGGGAFLARLGLPHDWGAAIMAVIVISFAATTLDTATRIQRFVLAELGAAYRIRWVQNRYGGSALAAGAAFLLVLSARGGKGGMVLWPIFGAGNQMLAALTLLTLATWLRRRGRPTRPVLIPFFVLGVVTITGMTLNAWSYLSDPWGSGADGVPLGAWPDWQQAILLALAIGFLSTVLFMMLEARRAWRRGGGILAGPEGGP